MYTALQLAKKYASYYRTAASSKGHGVHSPFVFDFIKFVKNDKTKYTDYQPIEKLRDALLANKSFIEVEDFGAGSSVIKTNKRQISKIAASSLKPKKFAQLLYRMVKYYQPKSILELGTSFGITTSYLASANPSAQVFTFEGAPSIAAIAEQNFQKIQLQNIQLIQGDFAKTLQPKLSEISTIDFAFIDGNHQQLPTQQYFELVLQHSHNNTILVFDDIHWSAGMEAAWHEIIHHPAVTLTIDLFFIGIVFLKNELKQKQHFVIRF